MEKWWKGEKEMVGEGGGKERKKRGKNKRATYTGPLEVGADLTSFDIADTVVVHRWKP